MATDRDTLIFQKANGSETKDLYADFGIKTTSVPLFLPLETKELPSRDWIDEDGEDVYFPDVVRLQAYDTEISMVYKGAQGTFPTKQAAVFRYMTTEGLELNIFLHIQIPDVKGLISRALAILISQAIVVWEMLLYLK